MQTEWPQTKVAYYKTKDSCSIMLHETIRKDCAALNQTKRWMFFLFFCKPLSPHVPKSACSTCSKLQTKRTVSFVPVFLLKEVAAAGKKSVRHKAEKVDKGKKTNKTRNKRFSSREEVTAR